MKKIKKIYQKTIRHLILYQDQAILKKYQIIIQKINIPMEKMMKKILNYLIKF